MNEQQAKFLAAKITEILKGRNIVSVHVVGNQPPEIRTNQEFYKVTCRKYDHNNKWFITAHDSYGVMGSGDYWGFSSNSRTVRTQTTNGYGDTVHSSWTVADPDPSGEVYHQMKGAQEEYWAIKA